MLKITHIEDINFSRALRLPCQSAAEILSIEAFTYFLRIGLANYAIEACMHSLRFLTTVSMQKLSTSRRQCQLSLCGTAKVETLLQNSDRIN